MIVYMPYYWNKQMCNSLESQQWKLIKDIYCSSARHVLSLIVCGSNADHYLAVCNACEVTTYSGIEMCILLLPLLLLFYFFNIIIIIIIIIMAWISEYSVVCHACQSDWLITCVSHTSHVIDIGWTSVRPSVHHTLVLCQNGSTYC